MPQSAHAMVVGNAGYIPNARAAHTVTTVARYPQQPLLESGWMVGDAALRGASAVLDVRVGRGHIILLTFRSQHQGQTLGTFKLPAERDFLRRRGPTAGATVSDPAVLTHIEGWFHDPSASNGSPSGMRDGWCTAGRSRAATAGRGARRRSDAQRLHR